MLSLLLEKEKEFHKLNAELEIRTKALLHEVDSVKQLQNNLVKESKQNQINTNKLTTNFESGDKWEYYEENKTTDISVLSKCLKTKITILQNELDSLKEEYKTKSNELKHLHLDYLKLEDEKNKLQQLCRTHKEQKEKFSSQIAALNSKLQSKDTELSSIHKENELLKKELKTANMNCVNNEAKLNKLLEENEKSKTNLKQAKQEEKELRDTHRKQVNDLTSINKKLEKQVTELTNGFKKQMILIDNLKKQKMYLESAKLVQISEDEFSRILDWKPSE